MTQTKNADQEEKISIGDIQKMLAKHEQSLRIEFETLTKKEKDVLMKTVKLQEEVGELANDILAVLSLQRKSKLNSFKKQNLYEEFADVLLSTLALANALKVDANRAIEDKFKIILKDYVGDR